jgi:hypothetical protein
MIDLYDLYQSFKSYVNTYVGGWFRPQSDFAAACNDISYKLFVKWVGEAEKSQEAKDNLFPFLISKNLTVKKSGAYGTFTVPIVPGKEFEAYSRFGTARIIIAGTQCVPCNEVNDGLCSNVEFISDPQLAENYYNTVRQVEVKMIDDNKWGAVMSHLTKGPTLDAPKIRQINNMFEVAPRTVSVIVMDYYRLPQIGTFVYTITPGNVDTGAGDVLVYNQKSSKPLEWDGSLRNEFLINLGERYGLFTRDQFLSNAMTQQKQTA